MREILFRGKCTDEDVGEYGEWVYGYFYEECGNTYILEDRQRRNGNLVYKNTPQLVDPATIGQYTGLKDKNGVWIFEGDIAAAAEEEYGIVDCFVMYVEDQFELCKYGNVEWYDVAGLYEACQRVSLIVTGNIHDKGEL